MIKFKKKLPGSTTFNLTETGRRILRELSVKHSLSAGDVVENLVINFCDGIVVSLSSAKVTGPKGGAPSLFPGKNRGTTTAVTFTPTGRMTLDLQVTLSGVSRGDWVELLLRREAGADLENTKLEQILGLDLVNA